MNPARLKNLDDVDEPGRAAIEQFFENYNRAHGRRFKVPGRAGRAQAHKALREGIAAYLEGE